MRRRNQRFPQSSCIGIMMKLRSACGVALFCVPADPSLRSKRQCQTCSALHALCSGRGIFPGQALRRASLRGRRRDFACAYLPTARKPGGMSRDHLRARSRLCFCPALLAVAVAFLTDPFYFRACPRLRLTSAPQFADKKRQLVAELPWHSFVREKIASKKILRTQ